MRRGQVLGLVLAGFAALLAVVVGVRRAPEAKPEAAASPTAAPKPVPADRIRIAAIVAEQGSGGEIRAGLTLAAQLLSEEWKDKPAIELILRDPGGSAETARAQLKALESDGVELLAELRGPELAIACAGPIRSGKWVLVSGGNQQRLNRRLGTAFFSVAPLLAPESAELTEVARRGGVQRVCVVYGPAQEARALAFRQAWGALPDSLMVRFERSDQTAWAAQQVKAAKVGAVVALVDPKLAGALAAAAPQIKLWVGASELGSPAFVAAAKGADLTRVRFVVPRDTSPSEDGGARARALAAWRTTHGEATPSVVALAAFDALQVLARAARSARDKAGKLDLKGVLRSLHATQHAGATGPIRFSGGERVPPPFVVRSYTREGVSVPARSTR